MSKKEEKKSDLATPPGGWKRRGIPQKGEIRTKVLTHWRKDCQIGGKWPRSEADFFEFKA